eukprot:SM000123S25837  [mRNA]  locus=s123:175354:175896:- [translate_table: standard]
MIRELEDRGAGPVNVRRVFQDLQALPNVLRALSLGRDVIPVRDVTSFTRLESLSLTSPRATGEPCKFHAADASETAQSHCHPAADILEKADPQSDVDIDAISTACRLITELELHSCLHCTDSSLEAIAGNLKQLRRFSVSGCKGITDGRFERLASGCSMLHDISVTRCPGLSI